MFLGDQSVCRACHSTCRFPAISCSVDLTLSGAQWRSLSNLGHSGSRPILVFHHLRSQRSVYVGRPGAWLVHALSRPGCCCSLVIAPLYVLFLFPSHVLVVVTHPHSSAYLLFCMWSTIVRTFSGGMVLVPAVPPRICSIVHSGACPVRALLRSGTDPLWHWSALALVNPSRGA